MTAGDHPQQKDLGSAAAAALPRESRGIAYPPSLTTIDQLIFAYLC
jgi:hypothetical protein